MHAMTEPVDRAASKPTRRTPREARPNANLHQKGDINPGTGAVWDAGWRCTAGGCVKRAVQGTDRCSAHSNGGNRQGIPRNQMARAKQEANAAMTAATRAWSLNAPRDDRPITDQLADTITMARARVEVLSERLGRAYAADGDAALVTRFEMPTRGGPVLSGEQISAQAQLEQQERVLYARLLEAAAKLGMDAKRLELESASVAVVGDAFRETLAASGLPVEITDRLLYDFANRLDTA